MAQWRLTGRDVEIAAIDAAVDGDGAGVLLVGEAGVGKSRLVAEAAQRLQRRGITTHLLRGSPAGRQIPLAPWIDWPIEDEVSPTVLCDNVIDTMLRDASAAGLVVAMDDVDLLDDLSATVLGEIMSRRVGTVIATMRRGADCPPAVASLIADTAMRRMELSPLTPLEAGELIATALGDPVSPVCAQQIWELTRGNPLFLRAMVRQEIAAQRLRLCGDHYEWDGGRELSPTVIDLVTLQFDDVSEGVGDVLNVVTVAEPLETAVLHRVASAADVAAAQWRGLIRIDRRDNVEVALPGHPLYGEVRRRHSGRTRLRHVRGTVARALAQSSTSDPVRVGTLWLDSDLPPDAEVFSHAAQESVNRLDLVLAERLARAASQARADAAAALFHAHVLILLDRGHEADTTLRAVSDTAPTEMEQLTTLHLRATNKMWPLARPDDARRLVDQALIDASDWMKPQLLGIKCAQSAMHADPAESIDCANGLDLADLEPLSGMLGSWGRTIAFGDLGRVADAETSAQAGYRIAASNPELAYQRVALVGFHADALILAGLVSEALTLTRDSHLRCVDSPGVAQPLAAATHATTLLACGDLPAALDLSEPSCTALAGYGERSAVLHRFLMTYAQILARLGRIEDAGSALDRIDEIAHPIFRMLEPSLLLTRAWMAANSWRESLAVEFATQALDVARARGQSAREVSAIQTLAQFGRTDPAWLARLDELAKQVDGPRIDAVRAHVRARGENDPDGLVAAGAAYLRLGDRLASVDAAAQGSIRYRQAGLHGSAGLARDKVIAWSRTSGARSPATALALHPVDLTSREREIGCLLSHGLSNRAIADETGLSIRTVEGHIYRACEKTGSVDRHELANRVNEWLLSIDASYDSH